MRTPRRPPARPARPLPPSRAGLAPSLAGTVGVSSGEDGPGAAGRLNLTSLHWELLLVGRPATVNPRRAAWSPFGERALYLKITAEGGPGGPGLDGEPFAKPSKDTLPSVQPQSVLYGHRRVLTAVPGWEEGKK